MPDLTPEYKWELLFNDLIKQFNVLHMYPYWEDDPQRREYALATCDLLHQNISHLRTIITKGAVSGTNSREEGEGSALKQQHH